MTRILFFFAAFGLFASDAACFAQENALRSGFAVVDITPEIGKRPVYMAGFGHNRLATKVADPLFARAIVLQSGKQKIALLSVDLVGLFYDVTFNVRQKLKGFDYILISATHNHEGPDTLGLWGANPFQSGIDSDYLRSVENKIVAAVNQADQRLELTKCFIGKSKVPELLHDSRLPKVLHDDLVVLQFQDAKTAKNLGMMVTWNCHPETLGSKNTEISADFVASAVSQLSKEFQCPVVYFTGTVGGLMTSLRVTVKDETGKELADGTFEKTRRYGELLADEAIKAMKSKHAIELTPIQVNKSQLFMPIDNSVFQMGWKLGVLARKAYLWDENPKQIKEAKGSFPPKTRLCIKTEIGHLQLGQLGIAAIPGEIYPELVIGKVQDPIDPAADFPNAPIESALFQQMKSPHRIVIGLANDEIGYIIPKTQWDTKAPFCYGRKSSQYGEINSLGPDTAPILCEEFRRLCNGNNNPLQKKSP